MTMQSRFYKLYENGRWDDDWGAILAHGGIGKGRGPNGELLLERTGPFIPPVSFPDNHLVVVDCIRDELTSGLTGSFEFRPVVKSKIVKSDWETWDTTATPPWYSGFSEPEWVIEDGVHSPETAALMGDLWELVLPIGAQGRKPDKRFSDPQIAESTWTGADIFAISLQPTGRYLPAFVTENGRRWVEDHAREWFEFVACFVE